MAILDQFRLDGKTAIVTGGARGNGRAIARGLAEAGADVAIPDLLQDVAEQTRREIEEIGVEALAMRVDVTEPDQVQEMVDEVLRRWGQIDILVNNAGIARNEPAEEMSDETWYEVIDVNLNAVFLCSRAAGKHMVERGRGSVINISSMSGFVANFPQPQVSYNAAKSGVTMLTKSLASEWAEYGVRVNAIAPGYIETDMTKGFIEDNPETVQQHWVEPTPMQRLGRPEELAGAAVYLASDAASFTTGDTMIVDGGYTTR